LITKNPIHASLYRPVIYAGVAPQFLFLEVSAVFLLLFEAGVHTATVLLSLFYCLVAHPLAVYLCGRDPQIADVYLRSLRVADFYSALPAIDSRVRPVDPALPNRP
jgi:type IV secretory pathway TrbD component